MDVDSNGVVWTVLSSGHFASFDRRKCKGPLIGPTATGKHCVKAGRSTRSRVPTIRVRSIQAAPTPRTTTLPIDSTCWVSATTFRWRPETCLRDCSHWWTASSTASACRTAGKLLRQGPGRANRRSRRWLERPSDLDDIGQPSPVPRGRRHGKSGPGLQVPSSARPAGALVGFGIALAGFHGAMAEGVCFVRSFLRPRR